LLDVNFKNKEMEVSMLIKTGTIQKIYYWKAKGLV
jgi:hypothetical protein